MAQRKLTFGLLDSRMFNEFDGEWRMQFNSRKVCANAVDTRACPPHVYRAL